MSRSGRFARSSLSPNAQIARNSSWPKVLGCHALSASSTHSRSRMAAASSTLVALAICCMLCAVARASVLVAADSEPLVPTLNYKSKCPKLRIAIVNGVSFHFEILAGMLHVLKPYDKCIDVYMSPWIRKENYDGARCSARGSHQACICAQRPPVLCMAAFLSM
jgi:hypothetical protein